MIYDGSLLRSLFTIESISFCNSNIRLKLVLNIFLSESFIWTIINVFLHLEMTKIKSHSSNIPFTKFTSDNSLSIFSQTIKKKLAQISASTRSKKPAFTEAAWWQENWLNLPESILKVNLKLFQDDICENKIETFKSVLYNFQSLKVIFK